MVWLETKEGELINLNSVVYVMSYGSGSRIMFTGGGSTYTNTPMMELCIILSQIKNTEIRSI